MFTFAAIRNKNTLNYLENFQSMYLHNRTVHRSKLKFPNFITNYVQFAFWWFRSFLLLPQFVISFTNLNYPRNFDVYLLVSSLQLIREHNRTICTSKVKFSNLITNRVEFAIFRFSMIFTLAGIYNKMFQTWDLGRAAVCDCGTPWIFLLPFF